MKRILKTALATGLPFGIAFAIFLSIRTGNLAGGLLGGALSGVMFGLLLGVFAEMQRKRLMVQGDSFEGAVILHQGPANHWRGAESRGGWLILTTERLSFRSHGKNIQNEGVALPLDDVRGAEPYRSIGIIPNGLRVIGTDGETNSFVVSERGVWVERIEAALAARPG